MKLKNKILVSFILLLSIIFVPNVFADTSFQMIDPESSATSKATPPHIYAPAVDKDGQKIGTLPTPTGSYSNIVTKEVALDETIVKIINQTSNVFIGFSVLFIIVAGIQYVLAQGDEEKIKKAHKSILWSALGVILVMLSYTIIFIISTVF